MKVTNVIKEAITTRINEMCAEANKADVIALNKEIKRLEDEKNQRKAEIREKYKKLFMTMLDKLDTKKIKYSYTYYSGSVLTSKEDLWEKSIPGIDLDFSSDLIDQLETKINANQKKANKFINDVILALELGTKKTDLETLLNNIKF